VSGVYKKLAVIQSKLVAPKNQWNKFGNYSYRSCEDILEGLKPFLKEQSCVLIIHDEVVLIGERYYIKATVKLIDIEDNSEISNTAYAREEESKKGMDGSQVTGAASSYARKYALNGLFAIDDTRDSDATNTGDKGKNESDKPQQKPQQNSGQQKEYRCSNLKCNKPISEKVHDYSTKNFGKDYCQDCQNKIKEHKAAR
jgi:hypothetical protein